MQSIRGNARVVEALERLSVEAVGVTSLALASVNPDLELTLPQWRALMIVGSRDTGLRVGDVAARLGSSGPSTSRLVRRLEDRGLVRTQRDEADRRATLVSLTAAGEQLRSTLVAVRRDLIRRALAVTPLPPDDDLADALDHIADRLATLAAMPLRSEQRLTQPADLDAPGSSARGSGPPLGPRAEK